MRSTLPAARALLASALLASALLPACAGREEQREIDRIRIGWQVPWATQGQVVQVLKHTNLLALNGLAGDFKGFSYGGPLNEAALAGEVDVLFTADQPAAMLLARGGRWTIVGRLMYNRVAIYVPPESSIRALTDLKGKRVAIPYGAAAQRDALKAIREAGLDPGEDVESRHLDIYEQASIVAAGSRQSWGSVDALVGFDPTPALFEHQGLARMLHVGRVVSLVLMADAYLEAEPDAARRFLAAFIEAWHYYARHPGEANRWFQEESRLDFDLSVLDLAASVEPNVRAEAIEDVRTLLDEGDLAVLEEAAGFLVEHGLAKVQVTMADHLDQRPMEAARAAVVGDGYDPSRVVVTR
jgi:ABC-type nitrate/sulfonate/bicarbonate transport system substrate-binding protein